MKKIKTLLLLMIFPFFLASCASVLSPYDAKKPVGEQINYTITGIDAGAGIMSSTEKAISDYQLDKNNWQLQPSSTAAMTSTLAKAIKDKRPIVVTGWTPHWMFTKFDLKFLEDPKGSFGKAENIHTIVRKDLKKDEPTAYEVLDRFYWTPEEMADVMLQVNEGVDPEKAAADWLKANPEKLEEWTKGLKKVDGNPIKLTYVAWDSEIASTNVVALALNEVGYDTTVQAMEIQPMWASVATNAADAMVAAWLPNTAGIFYEDYKDDIEDLGINLEGAKLGLVVPTYMENINSIEDLK
ncbi:glycine/betaine ABC transporter [Carnobacterium maltaromaticum]|uniref:glycine betaine ABC transporter substrate-binding protein n=1 Tax=Carnobacterium maltaromaticum TaxID=2751 RepID=UPI000C7955CE|nr:glycine betaine ABC transporter substrate-binding protein [Carnobacterium maltaromaticum]PLS38600.1 glycine/betaine ABC transporter [Carnobacterium maltaromaticum]PLS38977.1 glycine/betaine ABC transporter [Carnobacterium maltaromaticum]PLS45247.1 glycine/betaine ABC transporter [Carnobacterium maltaromaticum]PLS48102.1 glycine/betaine ABC transporter [Carnobacterium maltaromaticum]PLS48538.1 glycine/betaine ABC transporter [Carnobacterium maltaromaticum]